MPKKPMDYSKTIIYKLVCKDLNVTELYVGHTTDFKSRKQSHKQSVENINHPECNLKKSTFIREHGGWSNWSMIEIEKNPCNDIHEACARERYWVETLGATLNSNVPSRSKKEYHKIHKEHIQKYQKEHYETNKERIQKYHKEWYKDNKEKILDQQKEHYELNKEKLETQRSAQYECKCGSTIRKDSKVKHLKSIKHCQFLETNNI
jgi:hypothetical protein